MCGEMAAVSSEGVKEKVAAPGTPGDRDKLTADEAEQYDRQIRLWGLEAQKR